MKTYRFRIQGEGLDEEGEWIGFFSTRQVRAESLEDARAAAGEAFQRMWRQEGRPRLSRLDHWRTVDSWTPRFSWLRRAPRGVVFYRGEGAEEAALDLDAKAFGGSRKL